jgi:16S rRNA G966 N2-methylase RsmD
VKGKHLGIPFHRTKIEASFRNFVLKHFAEENMLLILFAGTGNFRFESLSQNMAAKTFKTSARKDDF